MNKKTICLILNLFLLSGTVNLHALAPAHDPETLEAMRKKAESQKINITQIFKNITQETNPAKRLEKVNQLLTLNLESLTPQQIYEATQSITKLIKEKGFLYLQKDKANFITEKDYIIASQSAFLIKLWRFQNFKNLNQKYQTQTQNFIYTLINNEFPVVRSTVLANLTQDASLEKLIEQNELTRIISIIFGITLNKEETTTVRKGAILSLSNITKKILGNDNYNQDVLKIISNIETIKNDPGIDLFAQQILKEIKIQLLSAQHPTYNEKRLKIKEEFIETLTTENSNQFNLLIKQIKSLNLEQLKTLNKIISQLGRNYAADNLSEADYNLFTQNLADKLLDTNISNDEKLATNIILNTITKSDKHPKIKDNIKIKLIKGYNSNFKASAKLYIIFSINELSNENDKDTIEFLLERFKNIENHINRSDEFYKSVGRSLRKKLNNIPYQELTPYIDVLIKLYQEINDSDASSHLGLTLGTILKNSQLTKEEDWGKTIYAMLTQKENPEIKAKAIALLGYIIDNENKTMITWLAEQLTEEYQNFDDEESRREIIEIFCKPNLKTSVESINILDTVINTKNESRNLKLIALFGIIKIAETTKDETIIKNLETFKKKILMKEPAYNKTIRNQFGDFKIKNNQITTGKNFPKFLQQTLNILYPSRAARRPTIVLGDDNLNPEKLDEFINNVQLTPSEFKLELPIISDKIARDIEFDTENMTINTFDVPKVKTMIDEKGFFIRAQIKNDGSKLVIRSKTTDNWLRKNNLHKITDLHEAGHLQQAQDAEEEWFANQYSDARNLLEYLWRAENPDDVAKYQLKNSQKPILKEFQDKTLNMSWQQFNDLINSQIETTKLEKGDIKTDVPISDYAIDPMLFQLIALKRVLDTDKIEVSVPELNSAQIEQYLNQTYPHLIDFFKIHFNFKPTTPQNTQQAETLFFNIKTAANKLNLIDSKFKEAEKIKVSA